MKNEQNKKNETGCFKVIFGCNLRVKKGQKHHVLIGKSKILFVLSEISEKLVNFAQHAQSLSRQML